MILLSFCFSLSCTFRVLSVPHENRFPQETERGSRKVQQIEFTNILKSYELKMALENPLGTNIRFYPDERVCQPFARKSFVFMDFVRSFEPDTILHIGGVIAYHF